MAQALLTAVGIGLLGLVGAAVLGWQGTDLARHVSFGFFSAMVLLLAHSMMMFYLIGKGKAVKDAMIEGGLTGDHYRRIALVRKPVFSIGTLAMAVTMVAAIVGASVDTGVAAADCPRDARLRRDRHQRRSRSRSKFPLSPDPPASWTKSITCSTRDRDPYARHRDRRALQGLPRPQAAADRGAHTRRGASTSRSWGWISPWPKPSSTS